MNLKNVNFALELLNCAIQYELKPLIDKVVAFLAVHMDGINCYDIFENWHNHKILDLKMQARDCIMSSPFITIVNHRVFVRYHIDLVQELLSVQNAAIKSELDIFHVIVTWLTGSSDKVLEDRVSQADKLLSNIDLYKMNNHELVLLRAQAEKYKLSGFQEKVNDKLWKGPEFSAPLDPDYRLVFPRSVKSLTFTYIVSGVKSLAKLYNKNHVFESMWHKDHLGQYWGLRVTQEKSGSNKFFGIFLVRADTGK